MNAATIEMPKARAHELFQEYRQAFRDGGAEADRALMRGYEAISKGRQVLDLYDTMNNRRLGAEAALMVHGARALGFFQGIDPELSPTALMAVPLLAYVLMTAEYRLRRLLSFVDPSSDPAGSGYHMLQSLIAFGSGQWWGRGLGESRQKLFYLPEAHTDFVFSVIGEEMGLLGALVVLGLFAVVLMRGLRLTGRIEEPFDQYLAFGLTVLIGLQSLIHMGVVLGLAPTKGLVLPFISYGGTAMVINLAEAGILLGLSRRRI